MLESQRELGECEPVRLDARVRQVRFLIPEALVKQIGHANRDETKPLRQAITDSGIDEPEIVLPGLASNAAPLKIAVLMIVCRL
jgi:hypothetical protein